MKLKKNIKLSFFLVMVGLFAIVYSFVFMGFLGEINTELRTMDYREEIIKGLEEEPEFMEKTFGITKETELTDEKVKELTVVAKANAYKSALLISLLITMIFYILIVIPLLFFVLPFFTSNKAFYKYKLNEDDIKTNKDYYRNIISEHSASELSYIDNFKIDKNAVIADYLMLENKKVITYEDGVFKKVEGANLEGLNEVEKYLLSLISDKGSTLIKISYISYVEKIKSCCIKDKLLEEKSFPKLKFAIQLIISVLMYVALVVAYGHFIGFGSWEMEFDSDIKALLFFIVIVFVVIFMMSYPIYIIMKYSILGLRLKVSNLGRTNEGDIVNKKLEGLKIFIKDFSILEARKKKELILWQDYLVYSVMFGINKKVLEEYDDSVAYKN